MAEPTLHAFPMGDPTHGGNDGMTLRDWFAGQALGMVIRQCAGDTDTRNVGPEVHFARKAYALADAMLAERAKASS